MEAATMVYRSFSNEASTYLSSLFKMLSQNTIREFRNTNTDLKLPLLKTSSGQKWFSYKGARLWNNLSADVKNAHTQNQFKKIYKISWESFREPHYCLIFVSICIIVCSYYCNFFPSSECK